MLSRIINTDLFKAGRGRSTSKKTLKTLVFYNELMNYLSMRASQDNPTDCLGYLTPRSPR